MLPLLIGGQKYMLIWMHSSFWMIVDLEMSVKILSSWINYPLPLDLCNYYCKVTSNSCIKCYLWLFLWTNIRMDIHILFRWDNTFYQLCSFLCSINAFLFLLIICCTFYLHYVKQLNKSIAIRHHWMSFFKLSYLDSQKFMHWPSED